MNCSPLHRLPYLLLLLLLPAICLAAAPARVDVLFVGYGRAIMPKYVEACAAENVHLYWVDADRNAGDLAYYPPEFLKKFQVVVVLGTLEQALNSTIVGQIKPGILKALDEYYQAGGSILWVPFGESRGGRTWAEKVGGKYDVQSFEETVVDPSKEVHVAQSSANLKLGTYYWTTAVTPHPVTQGVRGLFLPEWGEWSWPGTVPMKFGKSWTVLVRGMDSTRTVPNVNGPTSGKEEFTPSDQTGTYAASPEVVGVRESVGASGRMMVFPLYIAWTWGNFGNPGLKDALMLNGDGVHPSDGFKLLINAYRWLAEPATKAGLGGFQPPPAHSNRPDLTPMDWSHTSVGGPEQEWKGIIGPRTATGGGSGTVAEWVAAAKAAGLSYVVFLEDPAKLNDASFKQFLADCQANSGPTFAAIPGFGYYDLRGFYRYNIGVSILPAADNFAPDGRIKEPNRIVYQHNWRVGAGFGNLEHAPVDPWWNYVTFGCAVYMYDGIKLIDNGFARYLEVEANSLTWNPLSVVRIDRPADLAAAAASDYLTVVHAAAPDGLLDASRGGSVQPSALYLTNGPRLGRWVSVNGNGSPFRPGADRFQDQIEASSEVGLKEVKLINAQDGSVYRRYDCAGAKEFRVGVDENHSQQWNLCPLVTDVNGRTAMGGCLVHYTDGDRMWAMGDRLMGMNHINGWDEKKETIRMFGGGIEITFHKGIPGGGEEPSSSRRMELKIQGIDGGDVYTGACKVRPLVATNLGNEPTQEAFRYTLRLASFDGSIVDYVGDHQYAAGDEFTFYGAPRLEYPNKLADITSRLIAPRGRFHQSVSAVVYEVTATFKQDLKFGRLNLGYMNFGDAAHEYDQLFVKDTGGTALSWLVEPGDKFERTGRLPVGGYVYQANVLGGAPGVIALSDNLSYRCGGRDSQFYVDGGGQAVKAGDQVTARFLVFMRPFENQTNNEWLEEFTRGYGIGQLPAYAYKVTQGTLRGINYFLDLDAADGAAQVEIGKYDLPHNLSLRVFGLPERAQVGYYDLDSKQVRMLSVSEGRIWTTVETNARAHRLYVGEFLRCDSPQARLSLVPDGVNWKLEVNNPTDQPLTCHVTGVKAFAPLAGVDFTVTIPAGQSERRALESATGTVVQGPWMEG